MISYKEETRREDPIYLREDEREIRSIWKTEKQGGRKVKSFIIDSGSEKGTGMRGSAMKEKGEGKSARQAGLVWCECW